jgi:superfamily II DNA or RNA helicase
MLGISAERKRTDGLYKIINWYMGPILHAEEQKPNEMVVVKKFHYKTSNKERSKLIYNKFTGEPDRSTMITNLVYIKRRNRFIIKLIEELFDQGKNILCLTGRIKQVELLYKLLNMNEYLKGNVGKYLGKMEEERLAISATKQIIIGTYNMAEEGLDIENLNVVILCTPKSAIKQSVGRILRKEVYEEHPIVIDIIDNDNAIQTKQSRSRDQYYHTQRYHTQEFYVADYELDDWYNWDDHNFIKEALLKIPNNEKGEGEGKGKGEGEGEGTHADCASKNIRKDNKFTGPIDCDELEFFDD